jgi:pyridoxamine--pyruvate transaminase
VTGPPHLYACGPVPLSAGVRAALGSQVPHHGDLAFTRLYARTADRAGQVLQAGAEAVLLPAGAGAALDAAVAALVRPGMGALVLVSGVFGARLSARLARAGADVHELRMPWDAVAGPAAVAACLDASGGTIRLVAAVHIETASGTLTDLAAISRVAHDGGALMLADCVSSAGGAELDTAGWGLDLMVAAPHKCIAGPAGLSMVVVSDRAWEPIERTPPGSLSLLGWRDWRRGFPDTPPGVLIAGLDAALGELLAEGPGAVKARTAAAAAECRAGMADLGLRLWPASEDIAAPCVTAVRLPDGLGETVIARQLRDKHGMLLPGSLGTGPLLRIGHMGQAARPTAAAGAVRAVGDALAELDALP